MAGMKRTSAMLYREPGIRPAWRGYIGVDVQEVYAACVRPALAGIHRGYAEIFGDMGMRPAHICGDQSVSSSHG